MHHHVYIHVKRETLSRESSRKRARKRTLGVYKNNSKHLFSQQAPKGIFLFLPLFSYHNMPRWQFSLWNDPVAVGHKRLERFVKVDVGISEGTERIR